MGSKDTATIRYMRQNPVFADAFNYFLFGGAPVIDPGLLEEMDTRELAVPYGGEEGVGQPVQRTRDILKVLTAKTDQHMAYLLLGIENQSHIHYAMPVRSLLYDALQYTKQVEEAAASHRKSGDYKGAGEDDFLSGFMKDDRLLPVVTLVIYFGKECWDGPLSLHERFRRLGRAEVDVLNACARADIPVQERKEETNVCEAIQEMIDEARQKGREEMCQGLKEMIDEARQEGREEQRVYYVRTIMQNTGWTPEQAMDMLGIQGDDRAVLMQQMNLGDA